MDLKQLVPLQARRYARAHELDLRRAVALRRGVGALMRQRRGSPRTWDDLVFGWGNPWSVDAGFLDVMAVAALDEPGPVLECGSGLTTLVLAALRGDRGASVWSLEHDPEWYRLVVRRLRHFRLRANVAFAPLRNYGAFEWYDVRELQLPAFSLVVCDGPPNSTRGGRFGLLPVLGGQLAPGCTILLDDASRPGEQDVLLRWQRDTTIDYELHEDGRPFARVRLGGARSRAE
jgi:hypothetical protein